MSNSNPRKSETECYNKLMNQSLQSNNTKDSSIRKNIRLRSNTIFAFQDDHIYSNIYTEDNEDNQSHLQNDTLYIPRRDNLNNSNFFSTVCDRSQVWFNLNNTTTEKNPENEMDISIGSIADEMEKNFRFLNEVDDDLNDAKLSLNDNEDISIISEKSSNTNTNMNMTTPVNKFKSLLQSEELRNMNTYGNTQHSFSSSLTNQNLGTSNGSSIFEDKRCYIYPGGNGSHMELIHNSVELPQGSPFRPHYNSINIQSSKGPGNMLPYDMDPGWSQNFHTPRNMMNPYAYSFCSDFGAGVNNTMTSLNNLTYTPKPFLPMRFNPNEDKSVLDNLILLIKDQNGCRMIQKKLEEKKEEFISKLFDKIKPHFGEVVCDQFGNYVIQKFAECWGEKKYTKPLLQLMKNKMVAIGTNPYGTRGLQKIIESITEDSEFDLVKEQLMGNVMKLVKDVNGNHVVQKILQVYPSEKNTFVIEEITENILEISRLKQGGCIFQKAVEKACDRQRKILLEKIALNVDKLINDENGNFIVQHTINLKIDQYNNIIFEYLKNNLIMLSKQKYSSNVIDKCILFEDSLLRTALIQKLIDLKCIGDLILDQYGNYVVQKALQVTSGFNFLEMMEGIKKTLKSLKQSNYGKKIYDNLICNYGEYLNVSTKTKTMKKLSTVTVKKPAQKGNKSITNNNWTNG